MVRGTVLCIICRIPKEVAELEMSHTVIVRQCLISLLGFQWYSTLNAPAVPGSMSLNLSLIHVLFFFYIFFFYFFFYSFLACRKKKGYYISILQSPIKPLTFLNQFLLVLVYK